MTALDQILRWPEVHRRVGLSRTTIWRLTRAGKFPEPVNLTTTSTGWIASDNAAWLEACRGGVTRLQFGSFTRATSMLGLTSSAGISRHNAPGGFASGPLSSG